MRQLYYPRSFFYVTRRGPMELSARAAERVRWLKDCRRPQWSAELAEAVQTYREQYGRDKQKLAMLLKRDGWQTSASTVGRIPQRLKARGVLCEPLRHGIHAYKRSFKRPYAIRNPKEHVVRRPGDLAQVDTLDVRPLLNVSIKQITARDGVCRWDVIEAYRSATARNARTFLGTLLARSPYPVKAVQAVSPRRAGAPGPNGVDRGSEFQAEFEEACQEKGIKLFVLPPRSPKLNGHVERAQRTHTEEFQNRYMGDLELKQLNEATRQ